MTRLRMLWGLILTCYLGSAAHEGPSLRRPISPEQPAWIIHIDVWNYADPQKIIDMVPEDVKPFVIFNIATSSSDDKSADGPAIYDSWMKVCAQNRVWAMIQCASGAYNRMPDDGNTKAYEKYFEEYPNFLGFNFAEQFWGFGDEGQVDFPTRLQLFADLMPICHQYGGYLAVSFTDSYYSAAKMPMAYLKRNAQMREFLTEDAEHFLCFEKYTLKKNFLDIESNCLGQWLGGYAGQYGIRFDSSGWLSKDDVTDDTQGASDFVRAAGAIPIAEHMMLTGETIMDGPELTWTECSQEKSETTVDGYKRRNWGWFPQFNNISLDLFRKILDGTIRIMSRKEVIERTKVCIVNDINNNPDSEGERNSYLTPETLFDGLYRSEQDQDGSQNHWLNNRWWMKTSGRYPTIPQVYSEVEGMTNIKKSEYDSRWTTISDKKEELDTLFAEEYKGDIYAGRHENGWVTYNPYQYDEKRDNGKRICGMSTTRAKGVIPFKYNTCDSISLSYAPYSLGIMKEYNDHITIYLTNYQTTDSLSTDTIRIAGANIQPTVEWKDRGNHTASSVETSWKDGVLTVSVEHNGPLDISIACKGDASNREVAYTDATITQPSQPETYYGTRQYEAEVADYKNTTIRKSGYNQQRDGYRGQGFAELTNNQSALRFYIEVPVTANYILSIRYQADNGGELEIDNKTVSLRQTDGWSSAETFMMLDNGVATLTVTNTGGTKVQVDCMTLEKVNTVKLSPDSEGEYHVDLKDLTASGTISLDAETGVVTQASGTSNDKGALRLFFNQADFSKVINIKVTYEGAGEIFRYLTISDNNGNSVNPNGNMGAFWSSKYKLNFSDYQDNDASKRVCMMEWTANAPASTPRTMTIKDILIKTEGAITDIDNQNIRREYSTPAVYYNMQGQVVDKPKKGIYIIKYSNGKHIKKQF
ncbi:MAG: glycosyl hydrolase family 98 [Prevotella sp.]|nr:glycosyl hydrolase family 98 [Prevotella sp.]MBR1556335.1 glycosyl hydrolase family 98 [Prevotella sp.]